MRYRATLFALVAVTVCALLSGCTRMRQAATISSNLPLRTTWASSICMATPNMQKVYSINNPLETWTSCRSAIMYINLFLANAEKVAWAKDEVASKMYCEREMGEAYGLRAMYMLMMPTCWMN